jgi:hypothetical protein
MNIDNSYKIKEIKLNNQIFDIRISRHSAIRIIERDIPVSSITATIESILIDSNICKIDFDNNDMIVINKDLNLSVVFAIELNIIKIVTVINKADVFIKSGTKIFKV